MTIIRMNSFDMGDGAGVQIDAGTNADLLVQSSQGGNWISRLGDMGDRTTLNANYTNGAFVYGGIQQLAGGGFVEYGTLHSGLGRGVVIQTFDASGNPISTQITPMDEQGGDALSGTGYTVTPTANGGFALTWTSDKASGTALPASYMQGGVAQNTTVYESSDVRVRYFDATGSALGASKIASTAMSSVNGATSPRHGLDQFIYDSTTLAGGKVAYVYLDTRFVGQDVGGAHNQFVLTVQVSSGPGSPGSPVKVDQNALYTGNDGGFSGLNKIDGDSGANVISLPNGGFAVVWTEQSYVADASVFGGKRFDGWDSKIRYFNANGSPTSAAIQFLHRGADMGNISKYIHADALPDGRVAIAYQDGVYGVNGNGQIDAYLGVISTNGTSVETTRINAVAATNTFFYTVQDLAVRSDGTIDIVYNDASLNANGFHGNHTIIERFSTGLGVTGATFGGGDGADNHSGGAGDDLITGGGGDDVLNGQGGADRIEGGNGNDTLGGGTGADKLAGGEGNDLLIGGVGADVLVGNHGLDTASYASSAAAVNVNLLLHTASGGDAAGDTLTEIENLIGSAFNDVLTGDDGDNVLAGLAGNDTLEGGNGIDTADYSAATAAVKINLGNTFSQNTGGAGTDKLSGIENLIGSAFNDTLNGDSGANHIAGGTGNDSLTGGKGNDVLIGGDGNDQFFSADGGYQDRLEGGAGNDTYSIDYNDTVVELADGGIDTVRSSDSVYGLAANVENVVLTNTTGSTYGWGNALANQITGSDTINYLEGRDGKDTINGKGGDDEINGGAGADKLTGGLGNDKFIFDSLTISADKDTITDFVSGQDHLAFSRSVFTAFSGDPAGPVSASEFVVGTAATTSSQHLIYNSTTGTLFYDADGAGGAAQIAIATLYNHPTLALGDLLLL